MTRPPTFVLNFTTDSELKTYLSVVKLVQTNTA